MHVHVPAGAIPKDGPSAGVTLAMSMISLFTGRPVKPDVAMTGEITLRGRVLPVGGIKEKVLAAHRAGIHTIVLPKQNEKDLADVPEAGPERHEVRLRPDRGRNAAGRLRRQPGPRAEPPEVRASGAPSQVAVSGPRRSSAPV